MKLPDIVGRRKLRQQLHRYKVEVEIKKTQNNRNSIDFITKSLREGKLEYDIHQQTVDISRYSKVVNLKLPRIFLDFLADNDELYKSHLCNFIRALTPINSYLFTGDGLLPLVINIYKDTDLTVQSIVSSMYNSKRRQSIKVSQYSNILSYDFKLSHYMYDRMYIKDYYKIINAEILSAWTPSLGFDRYPVVGRRKINLVSPDSYIRSYFEGKNIIEGDSTLNILGDIIDLCFNQQYDLFNRILDQKILLPPPIEEVENSINQTLATDIMESIIGMDNIGYSISTELQETLKANSISYTIMKDHIKINKCKIQTRCETTFIESFTKFMESESGVCIDSSSPNCPDSLFKYINSFGVISSLGTLYFKGNYTIKEVPYENLEEILDIQNKFVLISEKFKIFFIFHRV